MLFFSRFLKSNFFRIWIICCCIFLFSCQSLPTNDQISIEGSALKKILIDAAPIFGHYKTTNKPNSRWMARYPDSTLLVKMNLPGTHDSQTWNYTTETRKVLNHVRLGGLIVAPSKFYRCQEIPLISMLEQGIRVFDLRFAFDVTKTRLLFWHAQALQSQTASLSDVLLAFIKWLHDHRSEAILISLKYEESTIVFARYNKNIQKAILDALTPLIAQKYFVAARNELGTLGDARGKIILLRRFDLDKLPPEEVEKLPGIYFPTDKWTSSGKEIAIVYNHDKDHTAYIEDYFHIRTGALGRHNSESIIMKKFDVIMNHLNKAMLSYHDQLFWTFTSGERNLNLHPIHPQKIALGGKNVEGINKKLFDFFKTLKGTNKRLGIVMFDFSNDPPDLVNSFLEI